jgi:hypothetical protein
MSALASLAGAAALPASGRDVEAQTSAAPTSDWDLRWLDELRGKHKQLYDLGSFNLGADLRPLRYTRNFLDTFRDVYQLESPNINTLVGSRVPPFPSTLRTGSGKSISLVSGRRLSIRPR